MLNLYECQSVLFYHKETYFSPCLKGFSIDAKIKNFHIAQETGLFAEQFEQTLYLFPAVLHRRWGKIGGRKDTASAAANGKTFLLPLLGEKPRPWNGKSCCCCCFMGYFFDLAWMYMYNS